ncbi:MAG: permease-like cell division protein FtsX [Patescibacteria group bacterium]|nr:permease-like cell division protein FtsX [Patescibacteria group bacterium]
MKEIFKSIKRTPYQSLAGFLVLFFSFFLSLIILFSLSLANGILNYLETKPQVTVYFQPKTPENQIFKIRDELSQSGKTLSIKYISQKEAFEIYKNLNKDNPLLLEMISSDIFPPSLEIFAKKPYFLPEIAEYLKKQPDIDEVQFQKDIVDKLLTFTNVLRKISFIFFGYLIIMSIIVLTTTISFKIALKKDEIELLRLLGATNSYIRKPFLKESLFMGFIASIFSFLILLGLIFYLNPFLKYYFFEISEISFDFNFIKIIIWPFNFLFISLIFLFVLFFSCFISIVSTYLATNKYLKV